MLSLHNQINAGDNPIEVDLINYRKPPIQDEYIEKCLAEKNLNLIAMFDSASAYKDIDSVVIATPTNYDHFKNYFDTLYIEGVIDLMLSVNQPYYYDDKVGYYCRLLTKFYVKYAAKSYQEVQSSILTEFLHESKTLYDNLYPSRIIASIPNIIDKLNLHRKSLPSLSLTALASSQMPNKFIDLFQQEPLKPNINTSYIDIGIKEMTLPN